MFMQKVLKRRLPSLAKIEKDKFAVSGLHANLVIDAKARGKSAIAIKCLDLIVLTSSYNVGILLLIPHPGDLLTRSRNFSGGYGPDESMLSRALRWKKKYDQL